MPAMRPRSHVGSYDRAAVALQVCAVVHRLVMMRLRFLTRDRWAWPCQCGAEVFPVSVFLHGSWFDSSPLTHSLLQIISRSSSESGHQPDRKSVVEGKRVEMGGGPLV